MSRSKKVQIGPSRLNLSQYLADHDESEKINGEHLSEVAIAFGYKATEMCYTFGVTYAQLLKMNKSEIDFQPRHSMFIRYLRENTDIPPIPEPPQPVEFLRFLQDIDPAIHEEDTALILGLNKTSFRPFDPQYTPSPIVNSYMTFIMYVISLEETDLGKLKALAKFAQNAQDEAQSRGVSPEKFWTEGRWPVNGRRKGSEDSN